MKKTIIFGNSRACSCCEAQTVVRKTGSSTKSKLKSKNAKRRRAKSKGTAAESKATPKKPKRRYVANCTNNETESAVGSLAHTGSRDVNGCLNPIVLLERLPEITGINMVPSPISNSWTVLPSCSHAQLGRVTPLQIAVQPHTHSGQTCGGDNVNEGCFAVKSENPGFSQTVHTQDDKEAVAKCRNIRCSVTTHSLSCSIPHRSRSHHEKSSSVLASEEKPGKGDSKTITHKDCFTRSMSLSWDDCTNRREEGSRTGCSSICNPAFSNFDRSRFLKGIIKCQDKAATHGQHMQDSISSRKHRDLKLKRSGKHELKESHQQKFPEIINGCKQAMIKNAVRAPSSVLTVDGAGNATSSNSYRMHARPCQKKAISQEGTVQSSNSCFSSTSQVENPPGSIAAQRTALLAYRQQVRRQSKSLTAVPQTHFGPVCKNRMWKPCKYCPKIISTDSNKQREHNMKMHPFQCSICRWRYTSKVELVHHRKECEASRCITCPVCSCRYLKSQQVRHCHSQKHTQILRAIRLGAMLVKTRGKLDQYILGALCPEGPHCDVCSPFLIPCSAGQGKTRPALTSARNEDKCLTALSRGKPQVTHGQQLAQSDYILMSGDVNFFQDSQEQVGLFTDMVDVRTGSEVSCADADDDIYSSLSEHIEGELSFPALFEDCQLSPINVHEEFSISGCSSPHKVQRNCLIPTATFCSNESDDMTLSLITAGKDADPCTDYSSDMMSALTELTPTNPELLSGLQDHPILHSSHEISALSLSSSSSYSTDFLSMPTSDHFNVEMDTSPSQNFDDIKSILDSRWSPSFTMPCCSGEQNCTDLAYPDQDSGFGELS